MIYVHVQYIDTGEGFPINVIEPYLTKFLLLALLSLFDSSSMHAHALPNFRLSSLSRSMLKK